MNKKTNVMSLSLEPEFQQQLKLFARMRTKGNVSRAVRLLVEKHAVVDDDTLSISLGPDSQQQLRGYADHRTKGDVSEAVRDLVERYAGVDEDVVPILLKVPSKLRGDPAALSKWLGVKAVAIINALSRGPDDVDSAPRPDPDQRDRLSR